MVDAYSKLLEVEIVATTSAACAKKVLENLFALYGLPKMLVSDNEKAFEHSDFKLFLNKYEITHRTVPPYHAASSGQAKCYVFTLKQSPRSLE